MQKKNIDGDLVIANYLLRLIDSDSLAEMVNE